MNLGKCTQFIEYVHKHLCFFLVKQIVTIKMLELVLECLDAI